MTKQSEFYKRKHSYDALFAVQSLQRVMTSQATDPFAATIQKKYPSKKDPCSLEQRMCTCALTYTRHKWQRVLVLFYLKLHAILAMPILPPSALQGLRCSPHWGWPRPRAGLRLGYHLLASNGWQIGACSSYWGVACEHNREMHEAITYGYI